MSGLLGRKYTSIFVLLKLVRFHRSIMNAKFLQLFGLPVPATLLLIGSGSLNLFPLTALFLNSGQHL